MRSVAFLALLFIAVPATAQDEPAPVAQEEALGDAGGFDLYGDITLMSDYRFRGVSRSDEEPAAQVSLTLRHGSGFYAGARGTTLKGLDSFRMRDPGDVQLDLYAGYGRDLGGGFELDAGAMYYVFAGADGGTDYVEPYASLSYLIGPVYATAGAKYAPSQDAIADEDMLYLFGQVDVTVPFRPWSFSALVGHQDWGRFGSYWTWSIGGEYHVQLEGIPNTELGLRYVDTDLPSRSGQDGAVLLTLRVGF